jgi:hypothetical protein
MLVVRQEKVLAVEAWMVVEAVMTGGGGGDFGGEPGELLNWRSTQAQAQGGAQAPRL